MRKTYGRECAMCGSKQEIEQHHIDWNHKNNVPKNKIDLCKRCHTEVHKSGDPEYWTRVKILEFREKVRQRRQEETITPQQMTFLK